MNNADLKRYDQAKQLIRTLINDAAKYQTKTQKQILAEREKIISSILGFNKNTPQYLVSSLNDYFTGYYDAVMKDQTTFLYKVDGKLYKLRRSDQKDIDLPTWDTLPESQWGELGKCGGSYWRKTLNVFFDNCGA